MLFHFVILGDCIDLDLGMENGQIQDNKITASSDTGQAKNGRLNKIGSWCAATSDSNPYLQIDLQTLHIICAVSTQGNPQGDQWVETYTLQVSTDGATWTNFTEFGQVKVCFVHYPQRIGSFYSCFYCALSCLKQSGPLAYYDQREVYYACEHAHINMRNSTRPLSIRIDQ